MTTRLAQWFPSAASAALGCVLVAVGLLLPAASQANVPIYSLSPTTSSSQAGAHADTVLGVELGARGVTEPEELPCFCNAIQALKINTPAGLIAAPGNIPQCTEAEFATKTCPIDSQLGLAVVRFTPDTQGGDYHYMSLYNMQAREDQLALIAFPAPYSQTPIYVNITARTDSDYGLEFKTTGIPSVLPPNLITTIFWGVPADPIHDPLRFPFGSVGVGCGNLSGRNPIPELLANQDPQPPCSTLHLPVSANSPLVPFVQNPTACLGPLQFGADTFAYDLGTDHLDAPFPATTGCDQLSFDPTLSAKPTTTQADSASGLDVDLTAPQSVSPSTPTASAIRDVSVTLPAGFTVNPNAADGKSACTDVEAKFGSRDQAQCPEFSKIGTLAVTSSSFPSVLPGAMYLGEPQPGNRYRVFLVFDGFSLHVKLPGTATPDPATGQLTVTFKDLPQFNFQEFNMHIFGAERGLLATPEQCGTYPVKTTFTPWATPAVPDQTSTQLFTIDSGPGGSACPPPNRPFTPSFKAGVTDNTGGGHSPFSLVLTRPDGDQSLAGLNVTTPPGFSATLKGIPYCPQAAIDLLALSTYAGLAEQASPSCPAASQVGTVTAGAGAGTHPLYVPGKVYLAGPYKGAPLSLEIAIPAVSGPYDLGVVATRVALRVDPLTAQVSAISDPLPQILEGIPLRTRSVQVDLDRPGFALNPTNCNPSSVNATAFGDQGAQASLGSPFQVANCADLPYAPKLALKLSGGLKRRGHPAIRATFTAAPGEANSQSISVALPAGELLDNAHIGAPCTRVQYAAGSCPPSSVLGSAEVSTPLLDRPLEGPIFLRSSSHNLPDVVMDLNGQFHVDLVGRVDTAKGGGLRTTFEGLPDAPVSKAVVSLAGGSKGLFVNSQDLCKTPKKATVKLVAQNGAVRSTGVKLQTRCARKGRHG